MRNRGALLFSFFMLGCGFLTILWVSTGLIGKAFSQNPPAPAPVINAPPPGPAELPPDLASPPPPADLSQLPPDLPPPPVQDLPTDGVPTSNTEAFVPGLNSPDGYIYDPTGRRDPFKPYGTGLSQLPLPVEDPNSAIIPPPVNLEPLQFYDIGQLKVVGIIWEVSNPKAMIRDPLGKLHLVRKETKVGRNNGFVAVIREGEIVIVEPLPVSGGVQSAQTRVMLLTR